MVGGAPAGALGGYEAQAAASRGASSRMPFLFLLALLAAAGLYFYKKKSGALAGANGKLAPPSGFSLGQGECPAQFCGARAAGTGAPHLPPPARRQQRGRHGATHAPDGPKLLPLLLNALPNRIEPSRTLVLGLQIKDNRVLDFRQEAGRQVGSIYFVAELDEVDGLPTVVEEVWHFVKPNQSTAWKLAGIEALT
jgi:hypothetical protein